MIFTVVWTPSCQNDLATIWVNALDRAAVAAAADWIDATLHVDPYSDSESRSDPTRVMIVPPLGIAFDVSEPDCLVTVWAVWEIQ
jgi:hypothetical protein